jgi:hypothetical protein
MHATLGQVPEWPFAQNFFDSVRAPTCESADSGGLLTLEKLLARKGSACVMVDSRSSNHALPAE